MGKDVVVFEFVMIEDHGHVQYGKRHNNSASIQVTVVYGWLVIFSNTNLGASGWIVVLGVVKRQVVPVLSFFAVNFFPLDGGAITCCMGRVALDPRRHRCAAYPLETGRVCHRVALPWLLCVCLGAIGCCSQCWRQRVPLPWLLRCSSSLRTWTFWVGAAFLFRQPLNL